MKKMICMMLALVVVLALCVPAVSAEDVEEQHHWENFQWEEFDWKQIEQEGNTKSLMDWLKTGADLHYVFLVADRSDGAYTEPLDRILCQRFKETPLTFIRAVAKEDAQMQTKMVEKLIQASYFDSYDNDEDLARLILWLDEEELETDVEKEILHMMKVGVTEAWGDEIPRTGDPVVSVALGLVFSAAGGLVLLKKKKDF